MAALRHHHGRRIAVSPPIVHRQTDHGEGAHALGRLIDAIDRPLRYAAGDDLALLRIFRGTVIGTVAAALTAVVIGAIA